jgi:hypothetical protein
MGKSGQELSQQLFEQLTARISQWGLALPAIVLLQVTKPVSFIASQGLLLFQPLLGFLYDDGRITDYAELLADRANIDHLIAQLEADIRPHGNGGKEKV